MLSDLAMRAVASSHFRWMPGMLVTDGVTVAYRIYHDGYVLRWIPNVPGWPAQDVMPLDAFREQSDMSLVLEDAATKGCLLALVREVTQEPGLHVRCMLPYAPTMSGKTPPSWALYAGRGHRWGDRHETEAEALVSALEAAP